MNAARRNLLNSGEHVRGWRQESIHCGTVAKLSRLVESPAPNAAQGRERTRMALLGDAAARCDRDGRQDAWILARDGFATRSTGEFSTLTTRITRSVRQNRATTAGVLAWVEALDAAIMATNEMATLAARGAQIWGQWTAGAAVIWPWVAADHGTRLWTARILAALAAEGANRVRQCSATSARV